MTIERILDNESFDTTDNQGFNMDYSSTNEKKIPQIEWQVFSKHRSKTYQVYNVSVCPINPDSCCYR